MAEDKRQARSATLVPRLALLTSVAAILLTAYTLPGAATGHARLPHRVVLVSEEEPGEPLVVTGAVYAPDGATPVPGIRLDIHQADADGYYCLSRAARDGVSSVRDSCPDSPPRAARIRSSLMTGPEGRYEFRTIKPGSYPRRTIPAHIHFKASGAGYPLQYPHQLWFAGDPHLPAEEVAAQKQAGKFSYICEPERDPAGVLRCVYNIRLERR